MRRPCPRYIKRQTDSHHGRSWAVSIRRSGKKYQRQFGDQAFGGSAKARAAAEAYLRGLLTVLPKRPRFHRKYVNNKSGVAGVIHTWEMSQTGRRRPYFKAYWPKPGELGKVESRKFSINKYGRAEAFAFAVAARRQGIDDLRHESLSA